MTQPPTPQPSPKRALVELLGDKDRYCAAHEAAGLLFPGSALGVVRCVLLAAGLYSPRSSEPGPFVAELVNAGWRVIVPALGGPQPGDIFVVTDERRLAVALGLVSKPSTDGEWFQKPDRERMDMSEVDFLLRT